MSKNIESHIIEVTYPNGSHRAGATVFEGGIIVTTAHVLQGECVFQGEDVQASDFQVLEGRDLAVAKTSKRKKGLRASSDTRLFSGVQVVGRAGGVLKDAMVVAVPGMVKDGLIHDKVGVIFSHSSNPVDFGDCGNPVIDGSGDVVGIVIGKTLGRLGFYERIEEIDLSR